MAEVILRKIDEAELMRAMGELHRIDPELARALADVRIEEIRAGQSMAGFFVQLLAFSADRLRVDSSWVSQETRTQRLEKSYALAAQATIALWTAQGSLRGGADFARLLSELQGAGRHTPPHLAGLLTSPPPTK